VRLSFRLTTKHASMTSRRTLLQWIATAISERCSVAGDQETRGADGQARGPLPKEGDVGPTKTLLTTQAFDEVCLLSNYRSDWSPLVSSIGWPPTPKLSPSSWKNLPDYDAIFRLPTPS